MGTAEEVLQAHQAVLKELASGQLTPVQALRINSFLKTRRELIATQELARRVRALEQLQSQELLVVQFAKSDGKASHDGEPSPRGGAPC